MGKDVITVMVSAPAGRASASAKMASGIAVVQRMAWHSSGVMPALLVGAWLARLVYVSRSGQRMASASPTGTKITAMTLPMSTIEATLPGSCLNCSATMKLENTGRRQHRRG